MKYFFDTEFHEDKHGIELISIGIVKENGEEYYAVNKAYDQNRATSWLKQNVIYKLQPEAYGLPFYKSEREIRTDILAFCEDMAEVWGYCSAHDWFLLCRLMGGMMSKPVHWPWNCLDIAQTLYEHGLPSSILPSYSNRADVHNALADARWVKAALSAIEQHPST